MTTFNRMKIILMIFVLVVFAVLLYKSKNLNPNETKIIVDSTSKNLIEVSKKKYRAHSRESLEPNKQNSKVKDFIHEHVSRLGKVDNNPQKTEQELIQTARELNETDIQYLKHHAMNIKNSNDSRYLAVYLLGQSDHESSSESLKSISVSPIPTDIANKRQLSDELIIKAQAIEFLGKKWGTQKKQKLLHEILIRNNNTFIAGWARKNLN